MALAAGHDRAAFLLGVGHEFLDLLDRLFVDQRPLLHAGFRAVADLQLGGSSRELLDKRIIDAGLHEKAVGADAGLAGIAILRGDRAFHGALQVGVVENQERRIAAKLHRHLLHGRGRLGDQDLADFGGAGEGDLLDQRMLAQLVADFACSTRHHIDRALREADFLAQRAPGQTRIRRLRGRLHHRRTAGRQRRANLARQHGGREVPRRDRGNHASRLLGHQDAPVSPGRRHDIAIGAARFFGKPQHVSGGRTHLALGFRQRLALFKRQQFGQRILIVHDRVMQLAQELGAIECGGLAVGQEGLVRGLDRALRLSPTGFRHGADLEARCRIDHVDRRARVGLHPLAADQVRFPHELAVFLQHRSVSCWVLTDGISVIYARDHFR